MGTANNPWHRVIGVAKDVKQGGVDRKTGTELYFFVDQPAPPLDGTDVHGWPTLRRPCTWCCERTCRPRRWHSSSNRRSARPIPRCPSCGCARWTTCSPSRFAGRGCWRSCSATFAGLALLLAAIGTYGVLSYMVAERRREIGIRMALGADRFEVIALVMKQGMQSAAIGIAIGVIGAFSVTRLIGSLLFGVQPTDALTTASVIGLIATVAALASILPAWRASRLDPNVVLKAE